MIVGEQTDDKHTDKRCTIAEDAKATHIHTHIRTHLLGREWLPPQRKTATTYSIGLGGEWLPPQRKTAANATSHYNGG